MRKWIKVPGPGQFRGQGEWIEIDAASPEDVSAWETHRETGYLPTAEQEEKPS
jgi:hypothetical protein